MNDENKKTIYGKAQALYEDGRGFTCITADLSILAAELVMAEHVEAMHQKPAAAMLFSRTVSVEEAAKAFSAPPQPAQREEDTGAAECMDCSMAYSDFGLDTTLPDDQWHMINGSPNGLLCASCIVKRAAKLPGVIAMRVRLEFAGERAGCAGDSYKDASAGSTPALATEQPEWKVGDIGWIRCLDVHDGQFSDESGVEVRAANGKCISLFVPNSEVAGSFLRVKVSDVDHSGVLAKLPREAMEGGWYIDVRPTDIYRHARPHISPVDAEDAETVERVARAIENVMAWWRKDTDSGDFRQAAKSALAAMKGTG